MRSKYTPVKRKGVSLGDISAKVAEDGTRISIQIIDTPFELSAATASDLYEVLGDVMSWDHDHDDED